ncbi:MAG: DUF455 family protein [Planctomycetota bacterium]
MNRIEKPARGTVERWCYDFVVVDVLTAKLSPPPPPAAWCDAPEALRVAAPGRPACFRVVTRSAKTPTRAALRDPAARGKLLHTFLHHELQAAELFAWAVLAFPETPQAFRRGLVRLALEELEHLTLYRDRLAANGQQVGDFAVRDWFWSRVGACRDATGFVAILGLGLEGANLEHAARFAEWFRAAGDDATADVLQRVEREEVGHVAFACEWFERLTGAPLSYDAFRRALPAPLSPALFAGRPLNRAARLAAGFDAPFLERLAAAPPAHVPR